MKTTIKWVSGMAFDATADTGQTVRIDTTVEGGGTGSGMNPKKMLLASLNGCSAMDVIEILKKMKVNFTNFEIIAEAEQTTEHPKVFTFINMTYRIDASKDDLDKVTRAVTLSQEKYCGISAMLAKHCKINHFIELI